MVEYFDPFGLIMPHEISHYLSKSGKKIVFSQDEIQNRDTVLCGYWCLYYLIERQKGKSILDVIHHENFDEDNSDFIQDYFINHRFLINLILYHIIDIKLFDKTSSKYFI